jgi:hypothetical protein
VPSGIGRGLPPEAPLGAWPPDALAGPAPPVADPFCPPETAVPLAPPEWPGAQPDPLAGKSPVVEDGHPCSTATPRRPTSATSTLVADRIKA